MKKFLLTTMLVAAVSPAFAHDKGATVTLGGSVDTQYGHRQQKNEYKTDAKNALVKNGIVNDTKLHVKVDGQAHGLKYGGLVVLNADTSANKYGSSKIGYQTMVYGETKFGRLEAGTYTGAVESLGVSAAKIARATGGIAGDSRFWFNQNVNVQGFGTPTALTTTDLLNTNVIQSFYLNPTLISNKDTGTYSNGSKVTYYTPKFYNLKAGVSFIPDTEQFGTISNLTGLNKKVGSNGSAPDTVVQTEAFRNVVSGGLHFDHKMNEAHVKASLLGEYGTAKSLAVTGLTPFGQTSPKVGFARHNLKAWEAGLSVGVRGFTVAGSYGDLGKSGNFKADKNLTNNVNNSRTTYWTAGAAYAHHHMGVSVTYMESKKGGVQKAGFKPKYTNLSFGVDYKVAPGFMPYAEVSSFKLDAKTKTSAKNSGNVFLAGAKLQF